MDYTGGGVKLLNPTGCKQVWWVFAFFVTGAKREKQNLLPTLLWLKIPTIALISPSFLSFTSCFILDLQRHGISQAHCFLPMCIGIFLQSWGGFGWTKGNLWPQVYTPISVCQQAPREGYSSDISARNKLFFPWGHCFESAEQLLDLPHKDTTTFWSKATILLTMWESSFPLLKYSCLSKRTQQLFYDNIVWENYFC